MHVAPCVELCACCRGRHRKTSTSPVILYCELTRCKVTTQFSTCTGVNAGNRQKRHRWGSFFPLDSRGQERGSPAHRQGGRDMFPGIAPAPPLCSISHAACLPVHMSPSSSKVQLSPTLPRKPVPSALTHQPSLELVQIRGPEL